MNSLKSLVGIKSRKEKAALNAAVESGNAQIRAANAAAEDKQAQAAEMAATRRASRLGKRQLMWLPLGGNRQSLGAR